MNGVVMRIGKSLDVTEKVMVPVDPINCGACGRPVGELDPKKIIRSDGMASYRVWVVYPCDNCNHVMHFSAKKVRKK